MRALKSVLLFLFTFGISLAANAQCAMCRATVENSISKGHVQFAASLNTGIMYLFLTPYVMAGLIAYFWFRSSKKNSGKSSIHIRVSKPH